MSVAANLNDLTASSPILKSHFPKLISCKKFQGSIIFKQSEETYSGDVITLVLISKPK